MNFWSDYTWLAISGYHICHMEYKGWNWSDVKNIILVVYAVKKYWKYITKKSLLNFQPLLWPSSELWKYKDKTHNAN